MGVEVQGYPCMKMMRWRVVLPYNQVQLDYGLSPTMVEYSVTNHSQLL